MTAIFLATTTQPIMAAPVQVVATMSILGDLARDVGGPDVSVVDLVGANGDIHGFEPTPHDAALVASSKIMIANGLGLEGWLERLASPQLFHGHLVIASTGMTPFLRDGVPDPHAWQDVHEAELYLGNIAAGLTSADPMNTAAYAARLQATTTTLDALDKWIRMRIATVPPEHRRVITTHDAFGYFGRAYGIEFLAAVGMSEDSEPSAAGVAHLIEQIRQQNIQAVFIENMTDPRLIQEVAAETGVAIGGTLFADALSKPGEGGDTYERMMRHNVDAMVNAMHGP